VMLEVQLLDIMEDRTNSLKQLQQGVRTYADHKDLRFLYGRKLINDHNYPEAREQFSILVQQNPGDYDMLYSLALLSMEVNQLPEAQNYLQLLVQNRQKLDDAHYYLGYIAGQQNHPDQAIEQYQQVKSGSNFLQALRNLTELMVRANRYDEVHSYLQNVRFRNADFNIPILTMEANILIEEKKYEIATTVLNNSVGAFPNNVELLFLRSVLSQDINDLVLMESDLRKIILLQPQSPVAYNSLGYTLADRTNRYQEAYELIKRATELSPNDPAIMDSLGWVQYKLGMYREAREVLDKAYKLYPDPEVAAHLGEVLWVLGEKSAATKVWRSALTTQPDSVYVRNTIQRLDPSASF
jgi:tetratricopeptide (TPR) repeat protein